MAWHRESRRHSLARKGIKTAQKIPHIPIMPKTLPDKAEFYPFLWKQNKGIFYRGTSDGKGVGGGVLGEGKYFTWKKGMAEAFAKISAQEHGREPKVEEEKLSKDLKLLDAKSKTFFEIKKSLGVNPFDKVGDPFFAKVLTEEVKKKGYDGVISDDVADGLVVFEKKLTPFDYQDKNQEKIIHSGWKKGNSYRYILEGTGDIFRELTNPEEHIHQSYINEKIRRIERHFEEMDKKRKYFPETGVHPNDSIEYTKENNKDKFDKMISFWNKQPYKTDKQKIAIDLNVAMLKGDYGKAKKLIEFLK